MGIKGTRSVSCGACGQDASNVPTIVVGGVTTVDPEWVSKNGWAVANDMMRCPEHAFGREDISIHTTVIYLGL